MLAVIDYEAGNLHSVTKALQALGVQPVVTADPRLLDRAGAIVLPGVGSAVAAMRALRAHGLVDLLREAATSGRPFLGICLGMQVLLESSEEGEDGHEPCLGVLEGRVRRLPAGLKVPHMGWNSVDADPTCPLFAGLPPATHFYFVHSFYTDVQTAGVVAGWTDYGLRFPVAVWQGSLMATQFHPEKSGCWGLAMLRNFLAFSGEQPAVGDQQPAAITA
jgi:glutamine amidotransferase